MEETEEEFTEESVDDEMSEEEIESENENEIILGWNYANDFNRRKYYYVRKDWVFATKEEAEQKLAEIKGEKDDRFKTR